MKALKRIEAISLAIMLCLCSIPCIAFAEEASEEQVEGGKYVFTGDSDSYLHILRNIVTKITAVILLSVLMHFLLLRNP